MVIRARIRRPVFPSPIHTLCCFFHSWTTLFLSIDAFLIDASHSLAAATSHSSIIHALHLFIVYASHSHIVHASYSFIVHTSHLSIVHVSARLHFIHALQLDSPCMYQPLSLEPSWSVFLPNMYQNEHTAPYSGDHYSFATLIYRSCVALIYCSRVTFI